MKIEFLSTVAVIAPDPAASRDRYVGALGLALEVNAHLHSERIAGCKSFGIWPRVRNRGETVARLQSP